MIAGEAHSCIHSPTHAEMHSGSQARTQGALTVTGPPAGMLKDAPMKARTKETLLNTGAGQSQLLKYKLAGWHTDTRTLHTARRTSVASAGPSSMATQQQQPSAGTARVAVPRVGRPSPTAFPQARRADSHRIRVIIIGFCARGPPSSDGFLPDLPGRLNSVTQLRLQDDGQKNAGGSAEGQSGHV